MYQSRRLSIQNKKDGNKLLKIDEEPHDDNNPKNSFLTINQLQADSSTNLVDGMLDA